MFRCLEGLKNRLTDFQLQRIMIDFELSFINAFKEIFPGIKISGCSFHYSQCVWRNIQAFGLQSTYNNDIEFSLQVRMLLAIAYVPIDDVVEEYESLIRSPYYIEHEEQFADLLNYYESTWIGVENSRRRRSRDGLFEISMWNCFDLIRSGRIRSNNSVEGWHNTFNRRIRIHHASIGKINALKSEQNMTEIIISQINTGMNVNSKRRKTYQSIEERLKNIVLNYTKENCLCYLRNVACILSM